MGELRNKDLSGRVLAAAIKVHRTLGPGFIESIYENALCLELKKIGVTYERQKSVPILYDGTEVGVHRFDLLIQGCLLIELKTVTVLEDIFFSIGRSYMKALGIEDGLLLNFATMPLTIRRIGREWQPPDS
jgi:GxxExxY protein